jgi:hypothetical protein
MHFNGRTDQFAAPFIGLSEFRVHGVCLTEDSEERKEDRWSPLPAISCFLRYLRFLLFKQFDLLVFNRR